MTSGRKGEVDTSCAFIFLVPRAMHAAYPERCGLASNAPKIHVLVVGIFLLGELVARFYRPPFYPKIPFFGVQPAICFNIGSDRKHPLMFKIDIEK